MAWRPTDYFIEGELDNTVQGKVTGWMKFAGIKEKVIFELEGNFHRDIRGAKVRLRGDGEITNLKQAQSYMEGFATIQKGKAGDMTAGREPADYVEYPYFEWYSDAVRTLYVLHNKPDPDEYAQLPGRLQWFLAD